jgi:hypothetical protein
LENFYLFISWGKSLFNVVARDLLLSNCQSCSFSAKIQIKSYKKLVASSIIILFFCCPDDTNNLGSVANLIFSFFYFSVAKGLQPLCYGKIALHL